MMTYKFPIPNGHILANIDHTRPVPIKYELELETASSRLTIKNGHVVATTKAGGADSATLSRSVDGFVKSAVEGMTSWNAVCIMKELLHGLEKNLNGA